MVPDRSDPEGKKAYKDKLDANSAALRATAEFFLALAEMEQIDSDAWFEGKTKQQWVPRSIAHLEKARELYERASAGCSAFKSWFPKERKGELTPDIDHFQKMAKALRKMIDTLSKRKLPSLTDVHMIAASMREAQVVAERKAVALRGTVGHFPTGHR